MKRALALIFAFSLAACAPAHPYHMTDISGRMPRLDFHLIRAGDGAPVTGANYRGQVVALYFGYTNCPDICPATLANLAASIAKAASPKITLLFVTVDPDRDTPALLNQYVHAFSPQMVGLRGTRNQLADMARAYRVAYSVDKGPPYAVTHSNAVFFFDAGGRVRLVTTDTSDIAGIASDLRRLLHS